MSRTTTDTLKRLAGGTAFLFVGNVIGLGSTFVTRVVAARHLGPADYGLVILGVTTLNLLTLLALVGLHQGIARQLPREESPSEIFYGAALTAILVSVAITAIAFAMTDTIVDLLAGPAFTPIYQLFVVVLPLVVFARLVVGTARGDENATGRVLIWNICQQGLVAVAVVAAAILGLGLLALTSLWIGALVATGVVAAIFLVRYTDVGLPMPSLVWGRRESLFQHASTLVVFSLPLMLSGTMRLTMQQADNFLIGFYLLSSDVGVYDSTYTMGRLLFIVTATVGYLFLPIFSDLHAEDASGQMDRFYKLTAKWMAVLVLPAYLLMLFHPEIVLSTAFGTEYTVGAHSLQLVATGFFIHVAMGITGNGLIAIGGTRSIAMGNAAALVMNLGLNVMLIPRYGITGAAAASAVAYATANVYWLYCLHERADVQPFYRAYVVPLAAGTATFVVLDGIVEAVIDGPLATVTVLLGMFAIAYPLVIVASGGLEPEDWELLSAVRSRVGM